MVRMKLQAALVVCVVFVLGIVTGVGISRFVAARTIADIADGPPEAAQGRMISMVLGRRLHLSRDQKQKVREIFDRHTGDFADIRASHEPQAQVLREKIKNEITLVLDDKQRVDFERFQGEMEKRREHMGIGGRGPRHHRP